MNTNFAWNVRFNRPLGTMLDLLVGWGFLGSVAFVVVILLALGLILQVGVVRPAQLARTRTSGSIGGRAAELLQMFWSLTAVWCTLFITLFLANFTTTLWVLFWSSFALLAVVARFILKGEEARPVTISLEVSPQYSFLSSFLSILAFGVVVVSGITLGRFYWGEVRYAQGLRAIGRGAVEVAVVEFGKSIVLNPYRTQYHLVLARTFLQQAITAAGIPQPNVPLITASVGRAVNEAREATDRSPNNAAAWDTLAAMYANARAVAGNALEWEIGALARTAELEPTNPTLRFRLAAAYVAQNKLSEAKKELEAALTLKPDYVDAFMLMARVHEVEGNLDAAVLRAGDAVRFAPNSVEALYEFGRLSYNRGTPDDFARAEQIFQVILQVDPNYVNALFSLGLLAERRGEVRHALNLYRRVAELAPQNAEIRERIRALSGQ
jgi:cytochrome c-type biogenesis protein CcmH/NrfG